jgi:hypothetical protein
VCPKKWFMWSKIKTFHFRFQDVNETKRRIVFDPLKT